MSFIKALFAGLLVLFAAGCSNFGVAPGVVVRADHPAITDLLVDVSKADGLYARADWQTEFLPSLVKNAPGVFSKYNVRADVLTIANEAAARPSSIAGRAHRLTVTAKDMYTGYGTAYGFTVTLYSPDGVKLWQSTAGFAGSPFRNQSEAAVMLLNNLAEKLQQAGMFSAKGDVGTSQLTAAHSKELTGKSLEAFEAFKFKPYPRAFVIEDGGHFFMEWGQHGNDSAPAVRALEKCVHAGYKSCRVFAADNQVL
jgi:hypothetical protein